MYNFNSFGKSVCKLTKYMSKFNIFTQILLGNALLKNLHNWKQFYTTAGRDGRDKFQVWGFS